MPGISDYGTPGEEYPDSWGVRVRIDAITIYGERIPASVVIQIPGDMDPEAALDEVELMLGGGEIAMPHGTDDVIDWSKSTLSIQSVVPGGFSHGTQIG